MTTINRARIPSLKTREEGIDKVWGKGLLATDKAYEREDVESAPSEVQKKETEETELTLLF